MSLSMHNKRRTFISLQEDFFTHNNNFPRRNRSNTRPSYDYEDQLMPVLLSLYDQDLNGSDFQVYFSLLTEEKQAID